MKQKYRGRKLLRCMYLGPSQARGGGVYAIALGGRAVELFPACRGIIGNDSYVFPKEELTGIAGEDRRVLDVEDPERPINVAPETPHAPKGRVSLEEDPFADEEDELIPDVPLECHQVESQSWDMIQSRVSQDLRLRKNMSHRPVASLERKWTLMETLLWKT